MTNLFPQDLVLSEHMLRRFPTKYVIIFANRSTKYLWAYTVIGAEVNKAQLTKTLSLPATS